MLIRFFFMLREAGVPVSVTEFLALLEALGEPLLSTSLILPGAEHPETEAREIESKLGKRIDLIIEGGVMGMEQTTVVDLSGDKPVVVREGKGDIAGITG